MYNLHKYKCGVEESLTVPLLEKQQMKTALRVLPSCIPGNPLKLTAHYLLQTEEKKPAPCKLCKTMPT